MKNLVGGGTTAKSPDLVSITLTYRKKLRPKWMHTFEIDLTNEVSGTPLEQRAALVTAMETPTFVEVTFRNDTGNTRNIYADLIAPRGEEKTGTDETGKFRITALEQLAGA